MKLSRHFKQRMTERNINWSDINDTLKNPVKVGPGSGKGTTAFVGKKLVVVVSVENKTYITCFTRNGK